MYESKALNLDWLEDRISGTCSQQSLLTATTIYSQGNIWYYTILSSF